MANEQQRAREAEARRRAVAQRLASSRRTAPSAAAGRNAGPERLEGILAAVAGARATAQAVESIRPLPPTARAALGARRVGGGMRAMRPDARPATSLSQADLIETIIPMTVMTESRGDVAAVSDKGARGPMQVIDSTARKPGYGVEGIRDDTPEERIRVGEQLLGALVRHHGGDVARAWAAYNWQPPLLTVTARHHGDRWIEHVPQETRNYLQENFERLGRPAMDGGPTIPVTIPRLTFLRARDKSPIWIVRGVSEDQRRAIEEDLPRGTRLAPRSDGSFIVPTPHQRAAQGAVNRMANPIIIQLGHEWRRALEEAELERR